MRPTGLSTNESSWGREEGCLGFSVHLFSLVKIFPELYGTYENGRQGNAALKDCRMRFLGLFFGMSGCI
jgi:hypothetical protein